jgi:hypothetical protein
MQVLFVNISGFFQSDPLFSGRCWRKTMCFRMTKIPVLLIDFPFVSDKEPPSQSKFSNPHVCWLFAGYLMVNHVQRWFPCLVWPSAAPGARGSAPSAAWQRGSSAPVFGSSTYGNSMIIVRIYRVIIG